ncbi:hypothetical protein DBR32_08895 [Taibaiella sp. KBW10]|uniref:DUF58 domain-containing protein n=1 Tax=Taibaiella sp. KBW10 TaxID=2153357 RepID=UPI000F5A0DE3|nr:DUF58 domain-containing protein [Taibaiella sp. KBW10]RQO30827.1 hypothetical protein DBR32_08895 [Taibaiella sp. KBW10]
MKLQWNKIRYFLINMPIRFNFILMGLLMGLVYYWVRPSLAKAEVATSSYQPIVSILAKIAGIAIGVLLLFSLLSTLVAYLRYRIQAKHKKASFDLNLSMTGIDNQELVIRPTLHHAWRPFLGFISGRMLLANKTLSAPFLLSSTKWRKNSLIAAHIYGTNALYFKDIKEYQVQGAYIYFEDMFRLIRLPLKQAAIGSFYNPPTATQDHSATVQPQASMDMDVRIEQMRKVEGEYLNYKQFEYGDDVRRIVWKIYGKSRELVVRNPETRNPYASEILMYASFYQSIGTLTADSPLADELLNYYKNAVWSLYRQLNKPDELLVQYIPEQKISLSSTELADEQVQRQIAHSVWQSHTDIIPYFDTKRGSVFCIHSLSSLSTVQQLLDQIQSDQYVHFVTLSDCFEGSKRFWIRKIFFQDTATQQATSIGASWRIAPQRYLIQKNEAALKQLLKQYGY